MQDNHGSFDPKINFDSGSGLRSSGDRTRTDSNIGAGEPGIGYSRLKKWAIDSKLVFENYTKDLIVIRDNAMGFVPSVSVFAHFCAGDDYAGKANNIIIQENFTNQGSAIEGSREALEKERRYIELLAGAPQDDKFKGNYSIRPEKKDSTGHGVSIQGESEK